MVIIILSPVKYVLLSHFRVTSLMNSVCVPSFRIYSIRVISLLRTIILYPAHKANSFIFLCKKESNISFIIRKLSHRKVPRHPAYAYQISISKNALLSLLGFRAKRYLPDDNKFIMEEWEYKN